MIGFGVTRIQRQGGKNTFFCTPESNITSRKCGKKSVELRDAGNKLYGAMKNSEALKMYSRAVQFAPHDQIYKGV